MSRAVKTFDNSVMDNEKQDGTVTTDNEASVCRVCDRFEPQAWRKTMCKNCFHTKNEHGGGKDAGGGGEGGGGGKGEGGKGRGIEGGGGGRGGGEDSGVSSRKSNRIGPTGSHEKKTASADCATPADRTAALAEESASTRNVTSAPSLGGKKATSSADTKLSTTKAYALETAVTASTNGSTTTTRTTMTATTTTTKTTSDSKTTTPATTTSTTSSKPGTQTGASSKPSSVAAAAAALSSSTSKTGTDAKKHPPGIKISSSTASAKKLAEKFGGLKSPSKDIPEPTRSGPGKLQLTPKSPATTESPFKLGTTSKSTTTTTTSSTTAVPADKVTTPKTPTTPTLTTTKTTGTTLTSAKTAEDKNASPGVKTPTEPASSSKLFADKNLNSVKNDGQALPKKNEEAASMTAGKLPNEKKSQENTVGIGNGDQSNNKSNSILGGIKKFGGPPSPSTPTTQDPPQLKVTTGRRSQTPATPSPSTTVSSSPLSPTKTSLASSSSPSSPSSPSAGLTSTSKITPSTQTTSTNNKTTTMTTTTTTTTPKTPGSSSSKTNTTATTTATSPLTPTTTTTTKTQIPSTASTTTATTTTKAGAAATTAAAATVKPPKVSVSVAEPESPTNAKSKVNTSGTSAEKNTSNPQKNTPQKPSTTSTRETPKPETTTTTTTKTTTTTTQKKTPSSLALSEPNTGTKMKLSPSSSSGDKYLGKELESPNSPTPKVKTMVVESSKFAKSQAAAAAAAAAAEAAAAAAAAASTTTTKPATVAEYRPGEEFGENTGGYTRQPSSTRLNEEIPSTMFATTSAAEVRADDQNYSTHSYQGSNVTVRAAHVQDSGAEQGGVGYGRSVGLGEYSRQCSSSSTSSSSSDGKVRKPIVVEVQVRTGQRTGQQMSQPSGRSPSPAPAFMVLSPQGNNRLMRSSSSGFRSVSGFPSGRTSPVIFGPGMYGGGVLDDGGGSERSWDSGGSCYSPSPSSCSSPVSSSMRSVYRPSPSPSPTPGSGPRVIPLPVLHTTSAAMAAAEARGGPSEYGVSRSATASPFTPGYITPTPGFNTPPPPYSPSADPIPSGTQWKGATYPNQQYTTPHGSSSSGSGVHPNCYNTNTEASLNATNTPSVNKNSQAYNYNNAQDFQARDGRPVEQHYQQSAPGQADVRKKDDNDTRFDSERGYAGTAYPGKNEDLPRVNNDAGDGVLGYQQKKNQQRAGEYKRCHSDESSPDISERGAVSRHPSREDNTVISSADAVVSSGSPAALSAVAQPPVSISNDAKEEGSSVKTTRESNRDQGPKEQKHEFPDQPGSKSDRRDSYSSDESLSPEPDRGLSSKERLNFRIQISELEDKIYKLERKNTKIQKEFGEKLALEKIIGELKNQLRSMERKCSGLEEEKKELEDQIQIEKVKVTKGQLESRSLMELRKLLEESDQARMKLTEENELMRDEVNEMKVEIDEMYDQFRESEAEDFRELQKELEITAKNCRILQFKLRKAERRNEQVEADREQYEEKLRTLQNAFENEDARRHIQALEDEVKMAKEVSVRLHDELDILEEKRARVEEDNRKLQDMLELSDKKNFRMEMDIDKLRDKVTELNSSLAKALSNNDDSPNKKV